MDWSKGFSALYYASIVDPQTWRDIERFEITDGSISKEASGLRVSADIDCVNYENEARENWVRIWLDARQNGAAEHVPLFTGLATSPSRDINGNVISNKLECYSVLKPAQDVLLQRGWYAPADISGSILIKRLLAVTPAPVVIEGNAPTLTQAVIAEDGESNLSMAEKILEAINWRMVVSGDGSIHLQPKAAEPSAIFDALDNDSIEPELSTTRDWYECPNVFRAVNDDLSAIARDDSPDSPLSTVSRGREIWMEETDCDLAADESLGEYALRRLREEQRVAFTASYSRRFNPDLDVSDIVRLKYPRQGLDGLFRIESQSIELTNGCRTSEEVTRL